MEKSNKEIILDFYKVVANGKDLDAITNYFSPEYRTSTEPYVGTGINLDTTSDDVIKIIAVADNAPATGKLKVGDVIVSAEDDYKKWESKREIRAGTWGQGVIGTKVTLTVKRDGELVDVPLTRGLVEGFEFSLDELIDNWKHFLSHGCPDLKEEILHIVAEGDLVMVYSQSTGTITEYKRQAVWTSAYVCRMKDGKIVEDWGVGPGISYFTQLGFKIEPPTV